jgi:hypothetical protein
MFSLLCHSAAIGLCLVVKLIRCSVFVNGRSRPVIMENMRARIDRGDIEAERQEAISVRLYPNQYIHHGALKTCMSGTTQH